MVSQVAGPRVSFLVLAFAALIAMKFAVQLPDEGEGAVGRLSRPRFGLPSRLDTWSFIQGMTLDGLFVIGMSVLAAAAVPQYQHLRRERRSRCATLLKSCSGQPGAYLRNATGRGMS